MSKDGGPKGAGWLIGAIVQIAIGAFGMARALVIVPVQGGDYTAGAAVGALFWALVLFLGIRGLWIYRRSRRAPT